MVQIITAVTLSPALSPQGRGSIRGYAKLVLIPMPIGGRRSAIRNFGHFPICE